MALTSHKNRISIAEVRKHKTADDCWTILRGKVYDITAYVKFHPGGEEKLLMGAGKDMTSLFGTDNI
jgi:cytochrome-b5 reductase